MIHNISRFIAALALILLTAQTAGAQTVSNVPYIDADGNEQTATYATVVTSDMGGTSADNFSSGNGWYYVNSDVTLNGAYNTSTYTQNIILGDGATLTVSGLFRFQNASLNIYCQSGGTGRLVVSGSYGSNAIFSVTRGGTLTINGGTVEVTNTSNNGNGFNGNLVMNGGTATFTSNKGVTCYAITGSVTLNGGTFTATSGSWKGVCDKTVTIGDGKYFKDGSGNIYYGTLTDAQNNALNGVTLSPATKTEYIQACLGTGNDGSASKPYTISDAAGWDAFCLALQDNDTWNRFSGKTVQLGADITVTRMAGGDSHEFTGTFDGGGKTLTFNYANTDNNTRTAPFSYVDGATIQNLIVGGTISGTAYRAAGIIGETGNTTSHITNCVSSVDISSGRYTGGFSIGGNVEIEGCVFNGKIKGTTYSGGFIGYSYSAQVIKNSLFAPQDGSSISGGTFYYNGGGDVAPVNSYYTQALGTAQGKACHSVTAGTDVTIETIALTGTATPYTVSGITAYSGGGLQLGQTLYYGIGDQLSLTLSNSATGAPLGYQYGYTASAGTLSGTTLTMPDADVTISVNTATLRSDGQQHEVSYMTADGTTKTAKAIALDGHETVGNWDDINFAAGTYYVGTDITYANRIYLNGDVTLILANGKTMTLNGNTQGIVGDHNLTIYGQSLDADAGTLRYDGTSDGIYHVNNYEQHSGNVSITTTGSSVNGIYASDVTLRGGTLTVSADGDDARAISGRTHSILGGQLTANATGTGATGIYAYADDCTALTLGWTRPDDRITASSIGGGGTVAVADGKALTDGSGHIYTGTLTDEQKEAIAGKTLQPAALAQYIDANGQPAEHTALILDGTETTLAEGWYFVGKDISYNATLTLGGDVHLILADGKTMNVTTSDYARCIYAPDGQNLHIYGQSEGTGVLNAQTQGDADAVIKFLDGTLAINGGNVEATIGGTPFSANTIHIARETDGDALVIDRGTLTATANKGIGIYIDGGDARINGGEVTATGTSSGIDIRDHSTIPGILTLSGGTLTASSFYTFSAWDYAGTLAVASGLTYTDGTGLYDSTTETATLAALSGKTLQPCLALTDAANNTAAITDHAGKTLAVALSGRTLYKDGSWNTLCLPFAVDLTATDCPLFGATARTVTAASISGSTLNLTFGGAVNTLVAGTPYIIKWDGDGTSNIENPVFKGVTIDATERNYDNGATGDTRVRFCGTYKSTAFDSEDKSILLMGAENTLFYPIKGSGIGAQRAYFKIGDDDELLAPSLTAFNINFDDDDSATGIIDSLSPTLSQGEGAWYSIDGRKLDGKPKQHGIYINNGKKVVIK